MAANLTDSEERRLLDLSLPSGSVYLALFTAAPGEAGGGTEVTGGAYARQAISFAAAATDGSNNTTKTSSAQVTFPQATADYPGAIVGVGIMDAATAGTMRWYRPLSAGEQRTIRNGDTFRVPSGAIIASLD
jgi:hypothetical protein